MLDDTLTELLPESIKLLVELIGLAPTLKLVQKYGGTAIWIPKQAKPEHGLAHLIGFDAFKTLCAYAGDTALEIALCRKALVALRHREIINASQTHSDRQLALKYQTTERHIRRIRSNQPKTSSSVNLDLFNDLLLGS